jgi:hypothetical protein
MKIADQPAFPNREKVIVHTSMGYADTSIKKIDGLTKREYIAAKVAATLVSSWVAIDSVTGKSIAIDTVVKIALQITDELLNQLSHENTNG